MKKQLRCEDCQQLGERLSHLGKYTCKIRPELVRPHWLACEGVEPREGKGGSGGEATNKLRI